MLCTCNFRLFLTILLKKFKCNYSASIKNISKHEYMGVDTVIRNYMNTIYNKMGYLHTLIYWIHCNALFGII